MLPPPSNVSRKRRTHCPSFDEGWRVELLNHTSFTLSHNYTTGGNEMFSSNPTLLIFLLPPSFSTAPKNKTFSSSTLPLQLFLPPSIMDDPDDETVLHYTVDTQPAWEDEGKENAGG